MNKVIRIAMLSCLVASALTMLAMAEDMKFEASLDRNRVAIGETAQLGLSFYGTQSIPAPDIGNIEGLDIHYTGPSTMMTVINGRVSASITHMYAVLPLKIGKFQLGPFSFRYKGNTYASNMVFLEVTEERVIAARSEEPDITERLNLEDRISLVLKLDKQAAYVNELIPVSIKLYVNKLNVSDIQLPIFDQEGFSKVEFKEPKQFREEIDGIVYDVLEFNTKIFGTRPGEYRIGPAKIKCNIMTRKRLARDTAFRDDMFSQDSFKDSFFDDFFTRYERHPLELKSQEAGLVISPLPVNGKPQDFSGAVGDYQFIYNASPAAVKLGDPITVHMGINGSGNFNTILIPKLENTTGFKTYEPQVKTEENGKTFKQVLIPETDQVAEIPRATFNYFDPNLKIYRTITQGPIKIKVEKAREEASPQIVGPAAASGQSPAKEDILTRDIVYIKEAPGRWMAGEGSGRDSKTLALVIFIPLLALMALYFIQERRDGLKKDTARGRRMRALRAAKRGLKNLKHQLRAEDRKIFYETMFKTLQDYLGNRLGIPPGGITADVAEGTLMSNEIDTEIARKIKNIFEICDKARFAFSEVDEYRMKDDVKELEEVIRYFEARKI